MATLGSLQARLQGIGNRLQAENDSLSQERMNANSTLDFNRERPGSERRPKPPPFAVVSRPNTISSKPRRERPPVGLLFFQAPEQQKDSTELNEHVKEISRKKGIITIRGKTYQSTIDDMKYISELGNGTSGSVVKMCHKPSSELIAVKQMHRSGNLEEAKRVFFDLEVVLKSHDCPYIVQCLGCFVTDTDVWICMELMSTCLDKLIKKYKKPFPEEVIGKIAVATVKALHYLKESHGVIHRDVKPSNILLDEKGNIKLCDFGISGRLVDSKANTRSAGCAAYMAPERIDPPDPSKPDYDIRADVWSLGITLVELATGQFPYQECKTDFEVLTKVLQDEPPLLSAESGFSEEFRDFVKDCLEKDYKQRPKYKRLLEYPFIKRYEKQKVDIVSWFAGVDVRVDRSSKVSRSLEAKTRVWSESLLSPLLPRRSNSRTSSNAETSATPPPVAPRRRSRTPDTRCQDRFAVSINNEDQSNMKVAGCGILNRGVSCSPARSIGAPACGDSSRAFSLSPLPRSQPQSHSHYLGSNYAPKPYTLHSQYSNIYSQVPAPVASSSSPTYQRSAKPVLSRFLTTNNPLPPTNTTSHHSSGPSVASLRKTPEPVRFNPEPWAPRGRFAQPTHHHFRSLSHDLSSSPHSNCSRYPANYVPHHASPLVSRRIVESRAPIEKVNNHHTSSTTSSLPSTVISPHYRYTQEALFKSRPYYTPEPQRRTFHLPPHNHP